MERVAVLPEMLRWARQRADRDVPSLLGKFPKLELWERGEQQPTLRQLEGLASALRVPIGYLFLSEPPVEKLPVPDYRTLGGQQPGRPSPDLLDTIYACEQRQEWYRDFARSLGEKSLPFVGSVALASDFTAVAASMREALRFNLAERRRLPNWTEALRQFIEQADALGVLVMVSGIVGSNTRRKLDPEEFRGFALVDELAPLVFVNGADTKAAQMFTLAHELAHLWLGRSAVSNVSAGGFPEHEVELWCNRVAAELLIPLVAVHREYRPEAGLWQEVKRLARCFKVSSLVVLRRIYDAGGIRRDRFWAAYREEVERLLALPRASGGDFYRTAPIRVSKRFARALVISTLEGQTLHRDAFRMLGCARLSTFHELGHSLGVM